MFHGGEGIRAEGVKRVWHSNSGAGCDVQWGAFEYSRAVSPNNVWLNHIAPGPDPLQDSGEVMQASAVHHCMIALQP